MTLFRFGEKVKNPLKFNCMKKAKWLFITIIVSSCNLTKSQKIQAGSNNQEGDKILSLCLFYSRGDTAKIPPFQTFFYEGQELINFEDTLSVSDYRLFYCLK
jgi:hypothetical protein